MQKKNHYFARIIGMLIAVLVLFSAHALAQAYPNAVVKTDFSQNPIFDWNPSQGGSNTGNGSTDGSSVPTRQTVTACTFNNPNCGKDAFGVGGGAFSAGTDTGSGSVDNGASQTATTKTVIVTPSAADIKNCKTVTRGNGTYCCKITNAGPKKECKKNYHGTIDDVVYCGNQPVISVMDYGICCSGNTRSADNNADKCASYESVDKLESPADKAACASVDINNASLCCAQLSIPGESCNQYNTDSTFQKNADEQYCNILDDKRKEYFCCGVKTVSDSVQCKSAEVGLVPYTTRKNMGVNFPFSVVVPISSGEFPAEQAKFCGISVVDPVTDSVGDLDTGSVGVKSSFDPSKINSKTVNFCCSTEKFLDDEGTATDSIFLNIQDYLSNKGDSAKKAASYYADRCHGYMYNGTQTGASGPKNQSSEKDATAEDCKKPLDPNDPNGPNLYFQCCMLSPKLATDKQCTDYENGSATGTVIGGSQSTGGGSSSGFNSSGVQPQANAAALQACNVIKFVSLLDIVVWLKCIIGAGVIPLIFSLAFVSFLWGVFSFMTAEDKTKKEEAKNTMLWGMIGLFVMVSLWGIIDIVSKTVGVGMAVPFLQTDYLSKVTAKKGN